jgi:NAD(P)-dependent dehydrogenase (short-subunit alcohol dehydrogenase family)
MNLANAIAVVTGGSEGIGLAIARALGQAGARVAICSRTQAKVEAALRTLGAAGVDAVGSRCDVTDERSVERFATLVRTERGTPQVVVNNAGIGRWAPVEQMSVADWDAVMATNLRGPFLVSRAFLPAMKAAGSGTIVNVGSLAGRNALEDGAAYAASKHGLLGFAKSLMLEVRKHGLRVVTVCPGSVDTGFGGLDRSSRRTKRALLADDVAAAIVGTLTLPDRAMISELDIRPSNP